MKDLLVYVADADALAFMRSILNKPQALGIRPVSFDIERHPLRDAGMLQSGAELVRMHKGKYQKALLMWDHHGSGQDHKQSPNQMGSGVQGKLDSFTWRDNSAVTVLQPELEQWLWFCDSAVAAHCNITVFQLRQWVEERAAKLGMSGADLRRRQPKELFEYVMKERLKRTISPRDFEEIGKRAGVGSLLPCDSFGAIVEMLRNWFPPEKASSGWHGQDLR